MTPPLPLVMLCLLSPSQNSRFLVRRCKLLYCIELENGPLRFLVTQEYQEGQGKYETHICVLKTIRVVRFSMRSGTIELEKELGRDEISRYGAS